MTGLLILATLVALIPTDASSPSVQESAVDDDRQAVRSVLEDIVAASEVGDADAYVKFVAEDAVMMYSGMPAVIGREAVHNFVSDFFRDYRFKFDPWRSEEIKVTGDWAFHRYSGIAIVTPVGGGEPVRLDRKYVDILKKEDGVWKISHHIFNQNN